ncbi:tail fiber assembly protein, partial [Escherichia coli]
EKIKRLSSEHQELRTVAINELNNIKMAIDLEVATDYEIELFPKLKAYVLELSSLTTSEFSKKKFSFPVKPV